MFLDDYLWKVEKRNNSGNMMDITTLVGQIELAMGERIKMLFLARG